MSEREQSQRLYQAVAEHGDESMVIRLLTAILERQDTFIDKQAELEAKLDGHMTREESAIGRWMDSLPKRPDGAPDVDGHREYHQALIEESRSRAQMWRELRTEILKKGTWGVVMVIGALIAYWWNHEVKR